MQATMIRFSTMVATLGVMAGGSYWTALAIQNGQPGAFLLRFLLVVLVGTYYLVLYRVQNGTFVRPGQQSPHSV